MSQAHVHFYQVLPFGYLHDRVKVSQPLNSRNQDDGAQYSMSQPSLTRFSSPQTIKRKKAQDASG